jgi:phosphatidylinositol glycan class N
LIAWGKGIRGPLPDPNPSSHNGYSLPWNLGNIYRRDVEQADVTALMAALIGINWPINSVGVLPDVDPTRPGFLEAGEGGLEAKLALVNAKVRHVCF